MSSFQLEFTIAMLLIPLPGGAFMGEGAKLPILQEKSGWLEGDASVASAPVDADALGADCDHAVLDLCAADLSRIERLVAAEEMAAEVAHAINNPLAVLMGRLQMRLERAEPPDPEDEILLRLARRIDRTVAGMLELSNRTALHPTPTPLATLLCEALRPSLQQAADSGVKLETFVDRSASQVCADPVLLAQAISAIVANAIEALPQGGTVRIEGEELAGAGALLIRVHDAGVGMNAEIAELAPDPFFSTKPGQTGLGLTLAHRIVSAHGGRLRVKSAEQAGTVVTFELPISR